MEAQNTGRYTESLTNSRDNRHFISFFLRLYVNIKLRINNVNIFVKNTGSLIPRNQIRTFYIL